MFLLDRLTQFGVPYFLLWFLNGTLLFIFLGRGHIRYLVPTVALPSCFYLGIVIAFLGTCAVNSRLLLSVICLGSTT